MTQPRLSICIPTYGREKLLGETLAHLLSVCDENTEIVISDNCSPDRTQDIIKYFAGHFRHFRAIRQTENRGAIVNVAAAMSLARGRYIYPLFDDDQLHFQGLQNAIAIMEQDPGIVAVFGGHEEWSRSTGQTFPQRKVEQRVDFAQGDKIAMFRQFVMLWNPVCRTEIFQRYCTFEKRSFGSWEVIGSLLERGKVSVIPDLFYKHAHSEPRMEYELTEGWYHDAYRAGFESFAGRKGPFKPDELASFISQRVTPAYVHGVRFAQIKNEFIAARHFMLRSRAYGLVSEPEVMAWEMQNLVALVAERILAKVILLPEVKEIVFEASPRLRALRERFGAIAPQYVLVDGSNEAAKPGGFASTQFVVTYQYGSFETGAIPDFDPTRAVAVEDVIETCRISDQPLAFDAAGQIAAKR